MSNLNVKLPEGEVPSVEDGAAKLVLDALLKAAANVVNSRGEFEAFKQGLSGIQELYDTLKEVARGRTNQKLPKLCYSQSDGLLEFTFKKESGFNPNPEEKRVLDYVNQGTKEFFRPLTEAADDTHTLPHGRFSDEKMKIGKASVIKSAQKLFADLLGKSVGKDFGNSEIVTNYTTVEVAKTFLSGLAKKNGIKVGAVVITPKRSPVENTDIRDGEVVMRLDKLVIVQLMPSKNKFVVLGPGDKVYEKGAKQGIDPFEKGVLKIKGAVVHDSVKEEYMGRSHVQEKKRGGPKMPSHSPASSK